MVSAYGLRFRGAASPIDERTSYDVFAHSCPSFKDYFDLEFNMALYSTESVGYVLRVKGADEGQIFNLFFDFRGDDILFRLNQEGKCVLIALPVSKAEAMKSQWFKVKIAFNLKQDEITLKIHDQEKVCKGVLLSDEFSPKIVFGKSDHIIDVPEIAVKMEFTYYGRQRIERRSNILMRELVTAGQLKRVPRTENNPHGLLIVNWRTLLNKDIEQKTKINY